MKRAWWLAAAAAVTVGLGEPGAGQARPGSPLTIDQLVDIKHPSNPTWSPDGRHVLFTWERVGGNDAKDAWMAANYLRSVPYVDTERVGVWGLSYGGFFTLIAMTDQPRLFRCGIDVAGVVDYAMYYEDPYHGGWTASRIGTPEQNPQVYAKASPISHIGRLERPLLVLHGTADVNVPYLHSVRLVDEALKAGKGSLLEFMTYPGEFHYFTREHVLRDAWTRSAAFFDKHLKAAASRSSN